MTDFQRCPEPEPGVLLQNTPANETTDYTAASDIAKHFAYWTERIERAETIGDLAVTSVASQVVGAFRNAYTMPYAPQERRQYLFGVLAQSHLCRHLFAEEVTDLYDPSIGPSNGEIILEQGVRGRDGRPLDPRIHVSGDFIDALIGPAGDEPSTWYQAGKLYVRRAIPAKPSVEFNRIVEQQGFNFDYRGLQSVFPYVAIHDFLISS